MNRPLIAGLLLAQTLLLQAPAMAEQVLDSIKDPLVVRLENALDVTATQPGEPFKAVLTEQYSYEGKTLPANTLFAGVVERVDVSKPFARPGYVVLDVQTAQLPNGYVFMLDNEKYDTTSKKIYHPKATTMKHKAISTTGFGLVSFGTSLPLKYGAGWSGLAAMPLAFASKMIYGAGLELSKKDGRPAGKRARYGVFRGTGIPGTYQFIAASPNPVLSQGSDIELHVDPDALEALFELGAEKPLQQHLLKEEPEL